MSKQRTVQITASNGNNYGQIINPADIIKSQEFAHLHAENLTRDFLTLAFETDVAGFAVAPVGMSVNVSAGRIYQNGWQYDGDAVQLTHEAAHATYSRIDLIVAVVTQDSPEQPTFTPFQRIRTSQELIDGVAPYPPVQFQVPLEKWSKATLTIKKGLAASSPVAPALAAGEIALWAVTVPANASSIQNQNFADQRRLAANLRQMRNEINNMINTLVTMNTNITTALNYHYDQVDVNWAYSYGGGVRNIHAVLAEIGGRLLPVKYRYPSILTGDGKVQAVGQMDGLVPVIDIPIGTLIQFGDKFVTIQADAFEAPANGRQLTTGLNNTDELFDGLADDSGVSGNSGNGNTVRINAPDTQKWLYVNYDGELYFKTSPTGSNSNECMLLRSTPNSGAAPTLLNYVNLRQAVIVKSGTATSSASSKQFVNDNGFPPGLGFSKAYGVRADDKSIYEIGYSGINAYDQIASVSNVTEGDKWVVELHVFSVY